MRPLAESRVGVQGPWGSGSESRVWVPGLSPGSESRGSGSESRVWVPGLSPGPLGVRGPCAGTDTRSSVREKRPDTTCVMITSHAPLSAGVTDQHALTCCLSHVTLWKIKIKKRNYGEITRGRGSARRVNRLNHESVRVNTRAHTHLHTHDK